MTALRPAHCLAAVFLLSFAFVWWLTGDRLILINDEGIYLSLAARIAEGEVLYSDLFGITGPGSFWLLALVFKVAGVSLATAQIAILTSVVFYISRKLADAVSAGIAAAIFLALNSADSSMMTNNPKNGSWRSAIAISSFACKQLQRNELPPRG